MGRHEAPTHKHPDVDWGKDKDGRLRKACSEDPVKLAGAPLGMYHCPGCGAMQMAGCRHLPPEKDYEGIFGRDWPPGYEDSDA